MKTMKKLLSVVLALAMCLSLLQGIAFAVATPVSIDKISEDGKATITWSDSSVTTADATKSTDPAKTFDATCGKDGQVTWTYEVGDLKKSETYKVSATGKHTWGEEKVIVDTAATCDTPGTKHTEKTCTVCNTVDKGADQVIPALGHDYAVTYKDLVNITIDSEGKPALIDKKQDGTYTEVQTCKNDSTHVIKTDKVIPATDGDVSDTVVVLDYKKDSATDNVTITGKTVMLNDCSKPGVYMEVTYDKTMSKVLKKEEKTIPAGHIARNPVVADVTKKSSANITVAVSKDGKSLVGTNKSCAEAGWFEYDVICGACGKKIETKRVDVAKSDKHSPAGTVNHVTYATTGTVKEENDTATCKAAGTKDLVVYCSVCGVELDRVTGVPSAKKTTHPPTDPVIENVVAPEAHKDGSYDSVTYCKYGGEELSRTTVTVKATRKDKYNWKFALEWDDPDAIVHEIKDASDEVSTIADDDAPACWLVATPTDADLDADQVAALKQKLIRATVTEVKDAATKSGSECVPNTRTYTAKVDAKYTDTDVEEPVADATKGTAVKMEETQEFWVDNASYTGHNYGIEIRTVTKEATETEDGEAVWTVTCSKCNDTLLVRKEVIPATGKVDPEDPTTSKTDISGAVISGSEAYRGEYFNVAFTVELDGKTLREGIDYVVTNPRKNNFKGVGSHKIVVSGIGDYAGEAVGYVYITETSQKVTVSPTKTTLKVKALKKKAIRFTIDVNGAKGAVSFSSSNKKVTVSKAGKVTVKKGTKKGTYKVTVKVAKNGGFKAVTKTVTITVK